MSIVCYNHAVDKVWQLNHEASPQNTLKHYILKFGKAVSEDQLGNSHHEVDNQSNGNTYQKQLQTDKSRFDMASNLSPTLRKTTKKKGPPTMVHVDPTTAMCAIEPSGGISSYHWPHST